jgi:ubiquinone/menaquinone biosynthesis C-methylase UbiE
MSLGRSKVRLEDEASWVFNRMVDAYESRPEYPAALIEAIAQLAPGRSASILDVGAGIGHSSIPLAKLGFTVTALEPAIGMLQRLQERAIQQQVEVRAVHGAAEQVPFDDASFDVILVADAVHFLNLRRAAGELNRVRAERGAVALVTCDLTPTPFMNAVVALMEQSAPRRPRETSASSTELLAICGVSKPITIEFHDVTPVTPPQLEQILRSISFIGPAMNPERSATFRERLHAIPHPPHWARTFTLRGGKGR